ncbi:DNA topoisomerase 3-beta [Porphyridium purpureum]|uniref:DNA topoisomerase n=1 Tax=Porphyridium purpureum TaxID=35688 RepID=A0A5J4YSC3_PORPP|nr:DNA topoisomerase 3-beta [Porphyridium purpureum]|eukprot:POR8008..scf296_7
MLLLFGCCGGGGGGAAAATARYCARVRVNAPTRVCALRKGGRTRVGIGVHVRMLSAATPRSAKVQVSISPDSHGTKPVQRFDALPVPPSVKELLSQRFPAGPMAFQAHALPLLVTLRHDVMACAQTGSGKTLAYLLPAICSILEQSRANGYARSGAKSARGPAAVVLCPTRELAQQVFEQAEMLARPHKISCVCCYGGDSVSAQRNKLVSHNPDVIIATPGRLQMFLNDGTVSLHALCTLAIDEADRMLDMGFEPQLRMIYRTLSRVQQRHDARQRRQTILCSATFPPEIQRLAQDFLKPDYYFIAQGRVGAIPHTITQSFAWSGSESDKPRQLAELLLQPASPPATPRRKTLVFVNRKDDIARVYKLVSEHLAKRKRGAQQVAMLSIHGDLEQKQRETVMRRFASSEMAVMLASDVAARGLDVSDIDLVVHYDLPRDIDTYVHRTGRTGRAGRTGAAVAFVGPADARLAANLVQVVEEAASASALHTKSHARAGHELVPLWLRGMAHVLEARRLSESHDHIARFVQEYENELRVERSHVRDELDTNAKPVEHQDVRKHAAHHADGAPNASFNAFAKLAYGQNATTNAEFEMSDLLQDVASDAEQKTNALEAFSRCASHAAERFARKSTTRDMPDYLRAALKAGGFESEANATTLAPFPDRAVMRYLMGNTTRQDADGPANRKSAKAPLLGREYYAYVGLFSPLCLVNTKMLRDRLDATRNLPTVLMVAEKPSVAEQVARVISKGRARKRRSKLCAASPVFEFNHFFEPAGQMCVMRVTSVVGHILETQFAANTDDPNAPRSQRGPVGFFSRPVEKRVSGLSGKLGVVEHLREESRGCSHLVLWLDCDREGENIAFEVISVTRERDFFTTDAQIFRARFSALNERDLMSAFTRLAKPNAAESASVDFRQELDLRVGVAFTRLLTSQLLRSAQQSFDRGITLLSYGPCQTPTLHYCVQQFKEVLAFAPRPFWKLELKLNKALFTLESGAIDHEPDARALMRGLARGTAIAQDVRIEQCRQSRPVALNTVGLLVAAGKQFHMPPQKVMSIAERLYSQGIISYPRTETTAYAPNFDLAATVRAQHEHSIWGKTAKYASANVHKNRQALSKHGKLVGDHDPITPLCARERNSFTDYQEWIVYECVTRHFLASVLSDLEYRRVTYTLQAAGDEQTSHARPVRFVWSHNIMDTMGFGAAKPWTLKELGLSKVGESDDEPVPSFKAGDRVNLGGLLHLTRSETTRPQFLQEHELVSLMDRDSIGTDASMSAHIANIVDRRYVMVVDAECTEIRQGSFGGKAKGRGGTAPKRGARYLVPTPLGLCLIEGFIAGGESRKLVEPRIRAQMEAQAAKLAEENMEGADLAESQQRALRANVAWFHDEFVQFRDDGGLRAMQAVFASQLQSSHAFLRHLKRTLGVANANPASVPSQQQHRRGQHRRANTNSSRPRPRNATRTRATARSPAAFDDAAAAAAFASGRRNARASCPR